MLLLGLLETWLVKRVPDVLPERLSVFAADGELQGGCCGDDPDFNDSYTARVLVREYNCTVTNLELLMLAMREFVRQYQQCGKIRWRSSLLLNGVADIAFELELQEAHTFAPVGDGDTALFEVAGQRWKSTSLEELQARELADQSSYAALPDMAALVDGNTL